MDMQLLLTFRIVDHITSILIFSKAEKHIYLPSLHSPKIKAIASTIFCLFVLFKPYCISSTFSVSGKCSHDKEPGNSIYCLFSPYI